MNLFQQQEQLHSTVHIIDYKLLKSQVHKVLTFFSNVWNKLSEECVHASSVNMFKNRIDKYLVKAGYT